MTKIKFFAPVKEMNGEFEKGSGIIMRKKKYRAPSGAVLKEGVQESYKIVNPRDYEKTPPKGAELANIQLFAQTKQFSSAIINSAKITDEELSAMTAEERTHIMNLRAESSMPNSNDPIRKRLSRRHCALEPASSGVSNMSN